MMRLDTITIEEPLRMQGLFFQLYWIEEMI